MPLCLECLKVHEHSEIEPIEICLSEAYAGYAALANGIASSSRGDILTIRKDLHSMIDDYIDDILSKCDDDYEQDQVNEWRNTIKKLETLRDPNSYLQQLIYYYSKGADSTPPPIYQQGREVTINHQAFDEIQYHMQYLFNVSQTVDPRSKFVESRYNKNKTRNRKHSLEYTLQGYLNSPTKVQQQQQVQYLPIPQQVIQQPAMIQQPTVIAPQVQYVQPTIQYQQPIVQQGSYQAPVTPAVQYIMQSPVQYQVSQPLTATLQPKTQSPILVQDVPQYSKPTPLVVYSESPIRLNNNPQHLRTPQTVTSVYQQPQQHHVQPFLGSSLVNSKQFDPTLHSRQ